MSDEAQNFLKDHLRQLIRAAICLIGGLQSMLTVSDDRMADFSLLLKSVEDLYGFLQQNHALGDQESCLAREVADLKEEVEDFGRKYSVLLGS